MGNPCEELNFHGTIDKSFTAVAPSSSTNHGYPTCHAVWDPTVLPPPLNTQLKVGDVFTHGNGSNSVCASRVPPKLCFAAHTAPLDIKFNANGTAAYVAFHGSWNKSPPDGFRLSKVGFDPQTGMAFFPSAFPSMHPLHLSTRTRPTDPTSTGQPIEPATSTTAAQNIMYNADNEGCPNRCFRPVGLAWDAKGRLFMASDNTNEIWIIGGAA